MILYDSQSWISVLKIRGSVFPRAVMLALPAAVIAAVVKFLELRSILTLSMTGDAMPSSSVYSGFTFVLGFVLMFRASQSYARYWLAATSVHIMQAEWFHACSTLIAFSKVSKKKHEEVLAFVNTAVRLFALIHAVALEEIAEMENNDFPLLDIQAFSQDDLRPLWAERHDGRKVELVFQWIQAHIIKNVDSGLLNVPSPLLTRVFQNLGNGLINYNSAQQVVIWPFPFAYAQMNSILVFFYTLITPIVVSNWTTSIWSCVLFTSISVICMIGLDLIAIELENPFGDDPNDLPVLEMQNIFNKDLIMLVDPLAWNVPKLLPGARTHAELVEGGPKDAMSLQQYEQYEQVQPTTSINSHSPKGKNCRKASKTTSLARQEAWARQGQLTPRYGDLEAVDITGFSLAAEPKDGTPVVNLMRRGSVDEMQPPQEEVLAATGKGCPSHHTQTQDTLLEFLRQQQALLQQQRDTSQKHLHLDSAFQERVLSVLEHMKSRSAEANHRASIPTIPEELPRGSSLWPCLAAADPSLGQAAAMSPCRNMQAPMGAQGKGTQIPPG